MTQPVSGGTGFIKGIRLIDAITLVVGMMIGSGIFIVSADIARTVGSSGLMLVVWIIGGFLTIAGALSFGELAAAMPEAGGQYIFLREAYGSIVAFLYGWTFFMVIGNGIAAAVSMGFAKFFGVLVPWVSADNVIVHIGPFLFTTERLVAMLVIITLTYINCKGLREGTTVQNLFTFLKTFAVIAIIIAGLTIGRDPAAVAANFTAMFATSVKGFSVITAVGAAMVGAIFSMDAWSYVCFAAAEVEHPEKNLPRALFIGTGIVIVLYLLINIAYMFVLPLAGIQGAPQDRVATAVASAILGNAGMYVIAVAITISTFGCANGTILTGSRAYYAMARDGLFFKAVGRINPKTHVPTTALVAGCIWSCVLALSGSFSDLLDYSMFATLIFYVLTVASVMVLRKKRPDLPRPYRAWGYPWLQLAYIILAATIAVILLICKPGFTLPGLLIVLSGIPVYFIWRRIER